jgi:methionyl-tRNA formyltransferase
MGAPAFAAAILAALCDWSGCEVLGVFTQPDRPAGRGRVAKQTLVKQLALTRRLPVFQPERLKSAAEIELLASLEPDVAVVAAYGLILPQAALDIPRLGCINVHASLLPKYRGAAPIQRAIMAGAPVTGVTIMQMDAGLDTGDILLQRSLKIGSQDTSASIHDQLADLGARILIEALNKLLVGQLHPIPQDSSRATYAHKLTKEEGLIDWNQPANEIHNRIRGILPWPGAYFYWKDFKDKSIRLNLVPGQVGPELPEAVTPGDFLGLEDGQLAIACADRVYLLPGLTPVGRKHLDAASFYNGYLCRCDGDGLTQ